MNTLTQTVSITVDISNTYPDGEEVNVRVTETVPAPWDKGSEEQMDEWAYEAIFPLTGTGRTEGDAWYDATIVESSDPFLVGLTFDWGY